MANAKPTPPVPAGDTPPPKPDTKATPPAPKSDNSRWVMATTVEIGDSKLVRGERFKASDHDLSASDIKHLKDKGYMVELED